FNVGLFPDSPTSDSSIPKARLEFLSALQADDVSNEIVLFVVRKSDVRHCGMRRLKPYAQGCFRHSWRARDIGKCGRLWVRRAALSGLNGVAFGTDRLSQHGAFLRITHLLCGNVARNPREDCGSQSCSECAVHVPVLHPGI